MQIFFENFYFLRKPRELKKLLACVPEHVKSWIRIRALLKKNPMKGFVSNKIVLALNKSE